MKTIKTTIVIDEHVKWDAHKYATEHKMTLSEVTEKALISYIHPETRKPKNLIRKCK